MNILDLGLTDYSDCWGLQKRLVSEVKGGSDDYLIITEHRPVITIGRVGSRNNLRVSEEFLKSKNIEVIDVDRGGDITYHGPGQIVAYPIIDLKKYYKDVHRFLHNLEDIVIALLKEKYIRSYTLTGKTGVWTDGGKIASIGIGVSNWITFHGLAINADCDLTPFKWINPCGFKNIKMTSIKEMTCAKIDKGLIKMRLRELFHENISAMA